MEKHSWFWGRAETPAELYPLLETLSENYPVREGRGGRRLTWVRTAEPGALNVTLTADGGVIEYGSPAGAARGLGLALAGRSGREKLEFKTLGIMLDVSRNAVMTVDHFKAWLRQLALMGYNLAMLYTEDTYQLPDEPYFGYMRGPYTMAELKEIDAYARRLGIELVACIQTLGHLEQMLQWNAYAKVKDTANVLLVDEPGTYRLVDKMLAFWSEALTSRRIHIGMDETHDLGRGRFMDQYGYQRGFDIFNRHLGQVTALCERHGLNPMIWSDMYFRMGNPNLDYYDRKSTIPDDVKAKIPAGVDLVYWDYYHRDEEFYLEWIKRHRELNKEPLMASGIWTWSKFWCDYEQSQATVIPCLAACRKCKLSEVLFTLWGDDGAYCEFDSALAGLCWAAELAYGNDGDDEATAASYRAVCGGDYRAVQVAGRLDSSAPDSLNTNCAGLLWDDPLMAKFLREQEKKYGADYLAKLIEYYQTVVDDLKPVAGKKADGADLNFALRTAVLTANKLKLRRKLVHAYAVRDRKALEELAARDVAGVIGDLRRFAEAFRTQWLRRNKPFGLDVIQVRIGGQIARWEELGVRLEELLSGKVTSIPELEVRLDGMDGQDPNWGGWGKWALSSRSIW